ncbi:unnamed protein product, partial [Rotaria socialis]
VSHNPIHQQQITQLNPSISSILPTIESKIYSSQKTLYEDI